MGNRISYFLTFGLFIWANTSYAQISEDVKENIKQRIKVGDNVSVVVGFIEGEKVDFFSYGKTALKNGMAVDENTVYEIGSISKVFTTILLADQTLQGNMSLEDPILNTYPRLLRLQKEMVALSN